MGRKPVLAVGGLTADAVPIRVPGSREPEVGVGKRRHGLALSAVEFALRTGVPGAVPECKEFVSKVRFTVPPGEPPALLTVNAVPIEDTFAEAFPMTTVRVVVTAETPGWARTAGQTATGYAASVIGCDAEAGIERILSPAETPDGRPGVSLLFFAFSRDALQKALVNRVGQ